MKQHKTYESSDKMINLIRDNYNILQSLSSFGISLGFGDKTVDETCRNSGVDTYTFLAVVNMTINGASDFNISHLKVDTLVRYLTSCHQYFLEYQLPFVRRSLCDSIDQGDDIGKLILKVYDTYAHDIRRHMMYEEKMLFPYIKKLTEGEIPSNYTVDDFVKHHTEADQALKEVKGLILKYMPEASQRSHIDNNPLISTLYLIYNNEEWLNNHQDVEDNILVPVIRKIENDLRAKRINSAISAFAKTETPENGETITDREKEIIIAVVQGMSNKQIAEHLVISPHTVVTHRKNITRKLQIHSTAGLTIYAIVNGLIDIEDLKKSGVEGVEKEDE